MELLFEHDFTPGKLYENRLILGECGSILNEMELVTESREPGLRKRVRFKGKLQEHSAVNKNRRMYSKKALEDNVDRLQETLERGGLLGELDHPSDSIIHFEKASHKITKLWWEGNVLMGEGVILNTPSGHILTAIMEEGSPIGMSSRGIGSGKVNNEGILEIGDGYKLITFDAVVDPSTYAAFQERIVNAKEHVVVNSPKMTVKNESTGIDKCNPDLLFACLRGAIKKQTNQIKARLNG